MALWVRDSRILIASACPLAAGAAYPASASSHEHRTDRAACEGMRMGAVLRSRPPHVEHPVRRELDARAQGAPLALPHSVQPPRVGSSRLLLRMRRAAELRVDVGEPSAEGRGVPSTLAGRADRCLVCARPSEEIVCDPCKARIRAEATYLRQKGAEGRAVGLFAYDHEPPLGSVFTRG